MGLAVTVSAQRLEEAPFTIEEALGLSFSSMSSPPDAADHFLAATRKVFDLSWITADGQQIKVGGIPVLSNG